jgi:hypothetical protein
MKAVLLAMLLLATPLALAPHASATECGGAIPEYVSCQVAAGEAILKAEGCRDSEQIARLVNDLWHQYVNPNSTPIHVERC